MIEAAAGRQSPKLRLKGNWREKAVLPTQRRAGYASLPASSERRTRRARSKHASDYRTWVAPGRDRSYPFYDRRLYTNAEVALDHGESVSKRSALFRRTQCKTQQWKQVYPLGVGLMSGNSIRCMLHCLNIYAFTTKS